MHCAVNPRLSRTQAAVRSLIAFLSMSAMSTTSSNAAAFTVKIQGSGISSVNQEYGWKPPTVIPKGFAKVCIQNQWDVQSTWDRLNGGRNWLHASNDAYIYLNSMDNHWWVDEPGGNGVFIAPETGSTQSQSLTLSQAQVEVQGEMLPPISGWRALSGGLEALPKIELIQ